MKQGSSKKKIKDKKNLSKKAVKKTADIKKDKHFPKIIKNIFFAILGVGIVIAFVALSGIFNVKEIIVEGNEHISKEQIISYSKIENGKNIFLVKNSEIEENVKENSYVKNVDVKKVLPNKIKISIEERGTEYIVAISNNFLYLNRQGYVLEISNVKLNVPELCGISTDLANIKPNDLLNEVDLEKLKTVNKIIDSAQKNGLLELISKIDITNSQNYILNLDSKNKVIDLGNGDDLNERFLYVNAILKEQEGKSGEIFVNVDLDEEYVYFREN